jgi:glyoxylase-like metal-dependent hydrolase (beta-lactamase superfamily II)
MLVEPIPTHSVQRTLLFIFTASKITPALSSTSQTSPCCTREKLGAKKELAWGTSVPTPSGIDPSTFSEYSRVKKKLLNGDLDVFGDGLVTILSTPGHTPGHRSLLVKLETKGFVILTGDLYHLTQSREERLIPSFNSSRAETLASIDRIERIAKNLHATVVVQHSKEDYATLPKLPDYWQ